MIIDVSKFTTSIRGKGNGSVSKLLISLQEKMLEAKVNKAEFSIAGKDFTERVIACSTYTAGKKLGFADVVLGDNKTTLSENGKKQHTASIIQITLK